LRATPLVSLLLLAALGGGYWYWQRGAAEPAKPAPKGRSVTVELIAARVGEAPVQLAAIGQIVASQSVAVRPQVSGTLVGVHFREGDAVREGQKLFTIDPAPYRAALAQAEAQLANAQASVLAAETQEKRLPPLEAKGYVTAQEVLDAQAAAAQARAGVQLAQAAVVAARVNVARAVITAPIAGRTGTLAVDAGNLVTANEATALVRIVQLDPVEAEFTVPQSSLAALQAALRQGPVTVTATAQTGGTALAEGRITVLDNTVDATTGTVRLKAEFPNPDETLWPGTFMRFTATLGTESARVLVPELAVQPGAEGSFVYTVGADGKAVLTPVTVARQVGREVVIAEGLKGGEKIIARAPRDLKPGMAVQVAGATPAGEGKPAPQASEAPVKAAAP